MQKKLPLGIFDSGFGGLSVAKSIHKLLPQEDLIYIADSAFTPYGDMMESDIIKRALSISDFLVNKKNQKQLLLHVTPLRHLPLMYFVIDLISQ